MTNLSKRRKESGFSESSKYRFFFSAYCTAGFLLLCWVYTHVGQIMYEKFPQHWGIESGEIPPYKFGFYVLLLGIPLFLLVCWRIQILNLIRVKQNSISRGFYMIFVFLGIIGISLINFGLNIYLIFEAIAYGLFLGLIDALRAYKEDFSFCLKDQLHFEAKLAKLQMAHERWSNALMALIIAIFGLLAAIAVQGIIAAPEPIRHENTLVVAITIGYLFVGTSLGIFWDIFHKMKQIEEKSLEIKSNPWE